MAEAGGISRQSYAAIESGSAVPSTEVALRLAASLGRSVGELFQLPDRPVSYCTGTWGGARAPLAGCRVRLVRIAGCQVAHPVSEEHRPGVPADGVVEAFEKRRVRVRLLSEAPRPAHLSVVGCDPAFGILAHALQREHGIEVSWSQRGSRAALAALAEGKAHIAGAHLYEAESDTWNGRWVRDLIPFPCTRISFAIWEQGILLRPVLRDHICGIGDLADRRLRLLNREEGSGSRELLDEALTLAGVETASVEGYRTAATGHLEVADGIAAGAADVGIAIRAAGLSRGLGFLSLRQEAYELIVANHFLDLPAVEILLDVLSRPGTRKQVEALGGYDTMNMGRDTA